MPRKPIRSPIKRKKVYEEVPEWQWDFLLQGEEPPPSLGFEGFCWANPCCNYHLESWQDTWQRVKDHPITRDYRRTRRPFAEEVLESGKSA